MIYADFFKTDDMIVGFLITGHANSGKFGQDIICASVSSATMLTANTITDFLGAQAKLKIGDNAVALRLKEPKTDTAAVQVILSLKNHLELLDPQHSRIKIKVSDT